MFGFLRSARSALFLVIFLFVLSSAGICKAADGGTESRTKAGEYKTEWDVRRLIFFAVLEGLYTDGVSNETVDLIIPNGSYDLHFVYGCPLCGPAYDAFKLYRKREPFYSLKMPTDTFGKGLDWEINRKLWSPDRNVRFEAIQGLIQKWVTRKLESMNISDEEFTEISQRIEEGRKQGMMLLNKVVNSPDRTKCPICDGAAGACKFRKKN